MLNKAQRVPSLIYVFKTDLRWDCEHFLAVTKNTTFQTILARYHFCQLTHVFQKTTENFSVPELISLALVLF